MDKNVVQLRSGRIIRRRLSVGSVFSITNLNDDVLMELFSYLSARDLFSISKTCTRLQHLSDFAFTNYKFDFRNKAERVVIKNNLIRIGPHIRKLSIHLCDIDEAVQLSCINVKSLHVFSDDTWKIESHVQQCNRWIQQLNLECFWFIGLGGYQLIKGVTHLKDLRIDDGNERDLTNLLQSNINIKRLLIIRPSDFDFSILHKLKHLECLHVSLHDKPIVKFNKNYCYIYAGKGKNNSNVARYENSIFCVLKSLNLSALSLCCLSSIEHTKFIQEDPLPRLKHLKLWNCSKNELKILVKKWRDIEMISVRKNCTECKYFKEESLLSEILAISSDRRNLSVYIESSEKSKSDTTVRVPIIIQIKFYFKSQQYRVEESTNYGSVDCLKNVFGF